MGVPKTAIVSHGEVDNSARETYGRGPVILRIGNGGAGATGLIRALAEDYLTTLSSEVSVEWVCNHSRNTQLALLHGYIDIALTYERDQEALAESEGWCETVGCMFHDHFVLAGPPNDPAGVSSTSGLIEAFSKIFEARCSFQSRADSSATMWKERGIWSACGLQPWNDQMAAEWYQTTLYSPAEALTTAAMAGAYLLTDRSTLLTQTKLRTVRNLSVYLEPSQADDILMNSCYAAVSTSSLIGEKKAAAEQFLNYLASDRGQNVVSSFGKEELGGFALFAPLKDAWCRSYLKGGFPKDGKWYLTTERQ